MAPPPEIKCGWVILNLFIEIEKDYTVYGDEAKFGGGKTIRDGMAQSATATRNEGVLDFVITSVMIIDHWGIVKADIGIKDGKIVGIGKAGNPDTMEGITRQHGHRCINRSTWWCRINCNCWWY